MDMKLKGRVAVIGGSSKGLGKGCAVSLAKEGADIVLCSNDKSSLDETKAAIEGFGVTALPLMVDMSLKKDNERIIDETLKKFGKIDILVNNSGGPSSGTFFDFADEDWAKAFNDVLLYVIRLCRLAIPEMKKNKWGRIINLTSLVVKEPADTLILSNVFRTGVVSMAKTISKDLIKDNITINNICPGAFMTDRATELIAAAAKKNNTTSQEIIAGAVKTMPLGRYQTPEELGDLVAFLCSENARGITGTTVQIDGGIFKGLM